MDQNAKLKQARTSHKANQYLDTDCQQKTLCKRGKETKMKTKKMLLSAAIALSTALTPVAAMAIQSPVFAEQTVTETVVNNTTDHKYSAYQIFKGTQDTDATTPQGLGDVQWGDGINYNAEGFMNALKAITVNNSTPFSGCDDAAAVANKLAEDSQFDNATARAFAAFANQYKTGTKTGIPANNEVTLNVGYYLIVDETESSNVEGGYKNLSLLQATKNGKLEIKQKNSVPNVVKKVSDEVYNSNNEEDKYQDKADHEIGETFRFQLTATLNGTEEQYSAYKTYKLVFNDTLSEGISFGEYGQQDVAPTNVIESVFVGTTQLNPADYQAVIEGNKLTITISDLIKLKTDKSIDGTLAGTSVVVTYKAHLNSSAIVSSTDLSNTNSVYLDYSNNPNFQGDGEPETGKTPEDTVFVGTYELPALKTDVDKKTTLEGAEFILQSKNGNNNGKYALIENGKITHWVTDKGQASKVTTGDDGKFSFVGVDAGAYDLWEVKAPDGYNTPKDPFHITVEATHDGSAESLENAKVTNLNFKTTQDQEGSNTVTITNSKAGNLPETGGMGTTLIYGVGSLLVGGAAIALITNKRMRKED